MNEPKSITVNQLLIGEILIKRNVITQKQLAEALALQKQQKDFVGEILVKLGYLNETDIVVALMVQCGFPYIAVTKYSIDTQVLKLIPEELARSMHLIPLDKVGDVLSIVMTNPLNPEMKVQLEKIANCRIATFISTRTEIDEAINRFYRKDNEHGNV